MRIGFLLRPSVPNINYRAFGPADALKRAGHDVHVVEMEPGRPIDIARLRQCDVVHTYRVTARAIRACMDDLRQRGTALTWDNDDDIRLLPSDGRQRARIKTLNAERDFRDQPKVFRRVDLVTTTSETLAQRFKALGAPEVAVIPNFPHPEQFSSEPRMHVGLVIGWVAGLEHHVDARSLRIVNTLQRLLDRHPDVRVVTIGVRLELNSERYCHHAEVPFPELHQHLRQFDIAIAPIADIPFNYARSDVKVKEYAAAGVPWLASARGPYLGLGARQGGCLVEDDQWEDALENLISSPFRRYRMRRRATAWGQEQSIDRHVDRWLEVFEQAIEARRRGADRQLSPLET